MAAHSSILAWRTSWTEGPGGLQSLELQRVTHDWSDLEAAACFLGFKSLHIIKCIIKLVVALFEGKD